MDSKRKLLEEAAIAMGVQQILPSEHGETNKMDSKRKLLEEADIGIWNPFENVEQALELAAFLKMVVLHNNELSRRSVVIDAWGDCSWTSYWNEFETPNHALCYAIVQCAAWVGRYRTRMGM